MSFKARLLAVLVIAALVVGSYNLGHQNNVNVQEQELQSYYQTENVYLWYSDELYTDFFTSAAVAFNEKNPDVRVIPQLVGGEEYLEQINEASINGEGFPDVYVASNDALEKASLAGLASKIVDEGGVLNAEHFPKAALDAVTYKDEYVGYPFFFETSILIYNKTYLNDWLIKVKEEGRKEEEQLTKEEIEAEGGVVEEGDGSGENVESYGPSYDYATVTLEDLIPKTIDGIKIFADDYDAPDGVEGVFKWDVSDVFYNYFFAGNYMIVGGETGDDENNIDIYNENTIKCMNIYQNLNQFFSIDADSSSYDSMIENFIDGKFVFTIATSDVIEKLDNALKESTKKNAEDLSVFEQKEGDLKTSFERGELKEDEYNSKLEALRAEITPVYSFGYARIPDLTDELESRSLSVTDALVINGYSEHKSAAERFAAFVTTEYADHLYTKTGKLSASYDANYEDERLILFQEEYAESIPLPKLVEESNFWVQLEITFTKIWIGEDTDALLRKLSEQITTQVSGEE